MNDAGVTKIIKAVQTAKDEIIGELHKKPPKQTPASKSRGPKNTRIMKIERKLVTSYLEIDCHRLVESCTPADATHVWNLPENKEGFDKAAKRTDSSRGYPDAVALCNAVLYWRDKEILKQYDRAHSK